MDCAQNWIEAKILHYDCDMMELLVDIQLKSKHGTGCPE
jgi:hypothetical protein